MKAIDLVRWAMQMTDAGTARVIEGMRAHALTPSTPGGKGGDGNHALWTLGHLCFVEGAMRQILLGEANPVDHWKPLFGTGTRPLADAKAYPSFDEVHRTYRELRASNLRLLDEVGDAGLDRKPKNVPPVFQDVMVTFGHTLLLLSLHNMVHYGQIADARRVAGLPPLM